MTLLQRFIENYKNKGWGNTPKAILLAVSGGRDSMVMADLFLKNKISFIVVHCNFQLRGEEANTDEKLVKSWCVENKIPFFVNHFDTKSFAGQWKKGIQETARKLRYDWFSTLCKENNLRYIATAHHANDNVETLLINLFKGTGIKGLQGIPMQNGNIIRPLLFATREMIDHYAIENNIQYRDDESNEDDKYLRNAVRHQIIPNIEKYFPNASNQIHDSIKRFSQTLEIYDENIQQKIKKLIEQRGKDIYIPIRKLKQVNPLETLCYELFKPYGFSGMQTQQLIDLMDAEAGKWINSPSHKLIKDREFLIITELKTEATDFISIEHIPTKIDVEHLSFHLSKTVKPEIISRAANIAFLDLSKIEFPILLRKWRQGDYFYPIGMGMKKKKLSRFFIDQKIPLHQKENIWVLESNKRIVWLAGYRLDERFKITDKTDEVLKIEMRLH